MDAAFLDGLMPKRETRALEFLKQNPKWDGRGVSVAILDTGVDPGAPGLQKTSDGRPKVINIVDCTGDGDVDTSRVVHCSSSTLTGVTGRTLRLNKSWTNPSKQWHIGAKRRNVLLPTPVLNRLKANHNSMRQAIVASAIEQVTRKEGTGTIAEKQDAEDTVEIAKKLQNSAPYDEPVFDCIVWFDGEHWAAAVDTTETGDLTQYSPMYPFSMKQQWRQLDEISQVNYGIQIYDEGRVLSIVTDSGAHGTHVAGIVAGNFPEDPLRNGVAPGAQIVSLKIGDNRVESMETGAGLLRAAQALADNRCSVANMSFGEPTSSPNIGRFVEELQSVIRSHGTTFVASAGNAGPNLSTVGAPGGTSDDIISVAAMITPAMMHAAYSLNVSKGDKSGLGPENLSAKFYEGDNDKHNENYGYQPEAPEHAYDVRSRKSLKATHYTWSSRGPAIDGYLGVTISAPGGAITCVPNWTLKRSMLMNGTSMSSPNVAGCVALLIGAAQQSKICVTPELIRRAIVNSAQVIHNTDVWASGAGMMDVMGAFQQLKNSCDALKADLNAFIQNESAPQDETKISLSNAFRYNSAVGSKCSNNMSDWLGWCEPTVCAEVTGGGSGSGGSRGRGIYWREPWECDNARDVAVSLTLRWHDEQQEVRLSTLETDTKGGEFNTLNSWKIGYMKRVKLESTASWVRTPEFVSLMNGGRVLKIFVDPTGLAWGRAHYAEVRGFFLHSSTDGSSALDERGCIFSIPITVVRPERASDATITHQITYPFTCNPDDYVQTSHSHLENSDSPQNANISQNPKDIVQLEPGDLARRFIAVPLGATWANILVERIPAQDDCPCPVTQSVAISTPGLNPARNDANPASASLTPAQSIRKDENETSASNYEPDKSSRIICVSTRTVIPHQSSKHSADVQFTLLRLHETQAKSVPVVPGSTLEVAVGQMWSSLGKTHIRVTVHFRGVIIEGCSPGTSTSAAEWLPIQNIGQPLFIDSAGPPASVGLHTLLHEATIKPTIKFSHVQSVIAPSSYEIVSLSKDRDTTQGQGQQHQLRILFPVQLPKSGNQSNVACRFAASRAHGADLLYDSPFDHCLLTVHDVTNMEKTPLENAKAGITGLGEVVGSSDVFMEQIQLKPARKYCADLRLVHPSRLFLEQFIKNCSLTVTRKLSKDVPGGVAAIKPYAAIAHASNQIGNGAGIAKAPPKQKWSTMRIAHNERVNVILAPPSETSLPTEVTNGDLLLGSAKFCDYSCTPGGGVHGIAASYGSPTHPKGFPIVMRIGAAKLDPKKVAMSLPEWSESGNVSGNQEHSDSSLQNEEKSTDRQNGSDTSGSEATARAALRTAGRDALATLCKQNRRDAFDALYAIMWKTMEQQLQTSSASAQSQSSHDSHSKSSESEVSLKLPLLRSKLEMVDYHKEWRNKTTIEEIQSVWSAVDEVLNLLPRDQMLRFASKIRHLSQEEAKEKYKQEYDEFETHKDALIDCLWRGARISCQCVRAILQDNKLLNTSERDSEVSDRFTQYYDELYEWVNVRKEGKYRLLALEDALSKGHYGSGAKLVFEFLDEANNATWNEETSTVMLSVSELFSCRTCLLKQLNLWDTVKQPIERQVALLHSTVLKRDWRQ